MILLLNYCTMQLKQAGTGKPRDWDSSPLVNITRPKIS